MSALKPIHTEDAPQAIGPYSQAVVVDGWVFASGQIALDPQSGKLLAGDAAKQAEQALANLSGILGAAGTGFARVVKTTIYLTDMADFQKVNEVYARFFNEPFPARATVQVAALPKGALVEIEVIARI